MGSYSYDRDVYSGSSYDKVKRLLVIVKIQLLLL